MTASYALRTGLSVAGVAFALLFMPAALWAADQSPARQSPAQIDAAKIASVGNGRIPACAACHGASGEGNPSLGAPRIAGLSAAYAARQLENLAGGKRLSALMSPVAKTLSSSERTEMAQFYVRPARSTLKAAGPAAESTISQNAGAQLALRGRWSAELPGCTQCHGAGGVGVGDTFPALAGQPALYLENQLHAWQSGARDPGPQGLMAGIAKKMSDADIKAVADYFSQQSIGTQGPHPQTSATASPIAAAAAPAPLASAPTAFTPPKESDLPMNEFGSVVRMGEKIFEDPQHNAAEFVGNNLRCSNCHLDAGRKADSAPMWGAYVSYPEYRAKNGKVNTFEQRLQGCFQYSMNGKAPPLGSPVLVALETYAYWLATGARIDPKIPGRGYPKLAKPALAADYGRGKVVYQQQCALCHGANGAGQRANDGSAAFPALWGNESFNWGAGMGSIANAAAFIERNMPLSQPKTLTLQEAWDVATYMDSQERPQDPRFLGSVEATRAKFHDSPDWMYGKTVDGHVLGSGSVKPGRIHKSI